LTTAVLRSPEVLAVAEILRLAPCEASSWVDRKSQLASLSAFQSFSDRLVLIRMILFSGVLPNSWFMSASSMEKIRSLRFSFSLHPEEESIRSNSIVKDAKNNFFFMVIRVGVVKRGRSIGWFSFLFL
jgi:hypothetical protein